MNKVVDFPIRASVAQRIGSEALKRLYAVWRQSWRAHGAARSEDFSSARLRRLMSWTGIAELQEDDAAHPRWSFVGTVLCRLAGEMRQGQEPFRTAPRFERQMLQRLLGDVARLNQPALAHLRLPLAGTEEPLHLELLALPLRSADGRMQVMLIMQPEGHAGALAEDLPWQAEGQLPRVRLTGLWMLREEFPHAPCGPGEVVSLSCRREA